MNNLRTPPPLCSCKNLPHIFFMVHLLHRLYGVDAPEGTSGGLDADPLHFSPPSIPHRLPILVETHVSFIPFHILLSFSLKFNQEVWKSTGLSM